MCIAAIAIEKASKSLRISDRTNALILEGRSVCTHVQL
ncbi:hypothetical protein GXM_03683 [Nostoc sphaeroides CCNUC1]|uniref:Uncharacterized protein n=1 Tax=Nostoc sphaeroides CCNUC1 TaxID=2653204 RepID=A0A5P8W0J4_9NOSO|nr:hypothetical protein GXM_03683 [Nostoc sphaeroides CCNUC1]